MEQRHKQQLADYYAQRRAKHSCLKCSTSSSVGEGIDPTRPQTPAQEDYAIHLRSLVGKLKDIVPSSHHEQLADIDKELLYVQKYIASGHPYPRGESPSVLANNTFTFSQMQPSSDVVQSIVKRVRTAGCERESQIRPSRPDMPSSYLEPHDKKACDNLHQVMSSVKQVLQKHPLSVNLRLDTSMSASQTQTDQMQKIKEQVETSHKSVLQGLQRSQSSQPTVWSGSPDADLMAKVQATSASVDANPVSRRQITIQNEMSVSKQMIEQALRVTRDKSTTT